MRLREQWEIAYQIYLDDALLAYTNATGKHVMEIIGSSKKDAYEQQFHSQWELVFPGVPLPRRSRIKLQEVDRTFTGYG